MSLPNLARIEARERAQSILIANDIQPSSAPERILKMSDEELIHQLDCLCYASHGDRDIVEACEELRNLTKEKKVKKIDLNFMTEMIHMMLDGGLGEFVEMFLEEERKEEEEPEYGYADAGAISVKEVHGGITFKSLQVKIDGKIFELTIKQVE